MRVIFLDIDGVLNTHLTPTRWSDKHSHLLAMDQDKVFLLNNMVDKHGFQVVLSSSWRIDKDWRGAMKANGLVFDFLDCTPDYQLSTGRGTEIKAWMDMWATDHPEDPIERCAIIDDDTSMRPEQLDNFFRCFWGVGLTEKMAGDIEKHLLK